MKGFSKRETIKNLMFCQRPPLSAYDIFQRICFDIQVENAIVESKDDKTLSIADRYDLAVDAFAVVISDKDLIEYLQLMQVPIVEDMEAFLERWTKEYRKKRNNLIIIKTIQQMDKH